MTNQGKIKVDVTRINGLTDEGTKTVYIDIYEQLSDKMFELTGRAFDNDNCVLIEHNVGVSVTFTYKPKNGILWYMLTLSEC